MTFARVTRDIDTSRALPVTCALLPPPRTSLRRPRHSNDRPLMRRPEVGIIALALLASACAIPTESPNWDMTWNLPVPDKGNLNVGVSSFLPSGVTTVGNPATAFRAASLRLPWPRRRRPA